MSPVAVDPVVELDAARDWLRWADDLAIHVTGQPAGTAQARAHLSAIAGWLRRHPETAAAIALNMPGSQP